MDVEACWGQTPSRLYHAYAQVLQSFTTVCSPASLMTAAVTLLEQLTESSVHASGHEAFEHPAAQHLASAPLSRKELGRGMSVLSGRLVRTCIFCSSFLYALKVSVRLVHDCLQAGISLHNALLTQRPVEQTSALG